MNTSICLTTAFAVSKDNITDDKTLSINLSPAFVATLSEPPKDTKLDMYIQRYQGTPDDVMTQLVQSAALVICSMDEAAYPENLAAFLAKYLPQAK